TIFWKCKVLGGESLLAPSEYSRTALRCAVTPATNKQGANTSERMVFGVANARCFTRSTSWLNLTESAIGLRLRTVRRNGSPPMHASPSRQDSSTGRRRVAPWIAERYLTDAAEFAVNVP